jgi:hypothetical protein
MAQNPSETRATGVGLRYLSKLGGSSVSIAASSISQLYVLTRLSTTETAAYGIILGAAVVINGVFDGVVGAGLLRGLRAAYVAGGAERVARLMVSAVVISLTLAGAWLILAVSPLAPNIWPGVGQAIVLVSTVWVGLSLITTSLFALADAVLKTVSAELTRSAQRVALAAALFALAHYGSPRLALVMGVMTVAQIFAVLGLMWVTGPELRAVPGAMPKTGRGIVTDALAFMSENAALAVTNITGSISAYIDRVVLVTLAGRSELAAFVIAERAASLIPLVCSPLTQLIIVRFSGRGAGPGGGFSRQEAWWYFFLPSAIVALIAAFIILNLPLLPRLSNLAGDGGSSLLAAGLCLYGVQRVFGHGFGAAMIALGQTYPVMCRMLPVIVLGPAVTFFFCAPARLGGLDLGGAGLALQMLLMQAIGVVLLGDLVLPRFQVRLLDFFSKHMLSVTAAFLCAWMGSRAIGEAGYNPMMTLLLSAAATSMLYIALFWAFLRICGHSMANIVQRGVQAG